jgi:hypothetical protein
MAAVIKLLDFHSRDTITFNIRNAHISALKSSRHDQSTHIHAFKHLTSLVEVRSHVASIRARTILNKYF